MTDVPELKPCPFCGGEADIFDAVECGPQAYAVTCKRCMCSSRVIFALKDDVTFDLQSAWNARADLHAEAIEAAEQRGYAAGIRAAVEIANDAFPDYEGGCSLQDQAARDLRDQIVMDIRALTPTPADPVAEAARVLADHMKERRWQYYPIEMPLTKDGQGPATLGDDAVSVSYEVWEAGTLRAVSSHECLPDAIEAALRALAQKKGE